VSCAETAEPIDLPCGLWTQVGRRKHKFSYIRLLNTIDCVGDVVLFQITLTTCLFCLEAFSALTLLHSQVQKHPAIATQKDCHTNN